MKCLILVILNSNTHNLVFAKCTIIRCFAISFLIFQNISCDIYLHKLSLYLLTHFSGIWHVGFFSYAMRKTKIIKTPLLFMHSKVTLWYSYDIYKLYTYELSFPSSQVVQWTMCSVCGLKILYDSCPLVFRLVFVPWYDGEKFLLMLLFYAVRKILRHPHTKVLKCS